MIDLTPQPAHATCLQHAANPVTAYCVRCGRPICDLCTFWIGSAIFCPECLSSGPSADERTSVAVKGGLSIALALVAVLGLVASLALGATGAGSQAAYTALGLLMLASALGGISLALIAREGARRTGSLLPLIGVVLNAITVVVQAIFAVIGIVQR